jgi:rare lipoprotein A (peptidoglycan hydrolase)
VAAWAVGLGIFLILVASATSKGATGGVSLQEGGGVAATGGSGRSPALDPVTAAAMERLQARLGLPRVGVGAAVATRAVVARMPLARATWYGPGLYGRRTACGIRLSRSTVGVAHRHLPCGSLVTFYYRGRFETVPVIDRGPFARGISWDLTASAARAIKLSQTAGVRAVSAG